MRVVKPQMFIGASASEEISLAEPRFGSLSHDIFDLDWRAHLPLDLSGSVQLDIATFEESIAFMGAHYASIFGARPDDHRFFSEAQTAAKTRFLRRSDRFAFREGPQMVGLLVGHPVDWSTYYWRSVAFLPEHQGRGLLAAALDHTDVVLRDAGIVRVEGEAAPNNYRQVRLLLRLGYCVTGSINSERWGTMLRLTKYLAPEAEHYFRAQFCRDSYGTDTARPVATPNRAGGRDEEVRNSFAVTKA